MATPLTLILCSGGIRSLVATAMTLARPDAPRLQPLHFKQEHSGGAVRREYARRQAEHFKLKSVIELDLAKLAPAPGAAAAPEARPALFQARTLLSSLAQAATLGAARVIWPGQFKGDFESVGRAAEMIVLAQHLAQLELKTAPVIETPLLDLDDVQVVELGQQLQAPWHLAWSCDHGGEAPCGSCHGCKRRKAAFQKAGAVDPFDKPLPRAPRPAAKPT